MRWLLMLMAMTMATAALAQPDDPEVHGIFDGDPMYSLLPLDGIPAIREPEFVTGDAADEQMLPGEPILAVTVGDATHAYSLWQLDGHEIVNDTVGGRAIAATW